MNKNKLLLSLCFSFVLLTSFVAAQVPGVPTFSTSMIKWTMCDQYNLTKWNCDAWWESPTNPYYIPETSSFNETLFKQDYLNKTEVFTLLSNVEVNSTEINSSEYLLREEFNSTLTNILNERFTKETDKFITEAEFEDYQDGNRVSDDSSTILFVIIGVILLVGGYWFMNNKQKTQQKQNTSANTQNAEMLAYMEAIKNANRPDNKGHKALPIQKQTFLPPQIPVQNQNTQEEFNPFTEVEKNGNPQ